MNISLNNCSALFNNLPKNNNNIFNNINVNDYSQIKSGNYAKLLKEYYKQVDVEKPTTIEKSKKQNNILSDKIINKQKSSGEIKTYANSFKNDLKNIKDKPDEKNVKSFVDNYNNLDKKTKSSESGKIKASQKGMSELLDRNKEKLSKIGITKKDDKLEFDPEKFKAAKQEDIKDVFNDDFIKKIQEQSSEIEEDAKKDIEKTAAYNNKAAILSNTSGLNFDSFV